MSPDDGSVPVWAANLQATVARIEARTDAIPAIQKKVEELGATMVPMNEHLSLMERVNTLWDTVNANNPTFQALVPEHRILMSEREQIRGAVTFLRIWAGLTSAALVIVTLLAALHTIGFTVTTK